MARVLVATPEPIGRRLAGPAIRAAEIARVVASEHDVVLVSLAGPSTSPIDGREVHGPAAIDGRFDAAIVQGSVTIAHPELLRSDVPLAIDWFDPFHAEALHRGGDDRIRRIDLVEGARRTLAEQALRGDFFLCSNESQREHWLGWLAAAGRLNVETHEQSSGFESLIALAPFGVSAVRPSRASPLRDTFDVIGPHDPVLLWAGGLHDWLDPLSIIASMPAVLDENPDTRLVFLAGPHPNTSLPDMGIRGEAIELASEMRLFGSSVLFVNQWIDYVERLQWLQDATIGVVADRPHLESRLAHRSRLLDHLAVGLPTVSTAGDPLSTALEAVGAAVTTTRGHDAIGQALAELVNDDERLRRMRHAANEQAKNLRWETTLAPLVDWLDAPAMAADRQAGLPLPTPPGGSSAAQLGGRIRLHLDAGGPTQVLRRGAASMRRRLGR